MKRSMASDIWSDGDVSLMGTILYYIDEDWENLHAMLIGCTGFTGERHTGKNIRKQTMEDLLTVGLTFEDIHAKVSDQGSNIKKAWGGLPGGYYVRHTIQLAVKEYLQSEGISDVVQKAKGMTTYFHRSGNRLDRLADVQKRFDMPQRNPPQTGNSVRWHYTHDSMNWFREQKVITQNYDINYGAEARHEDGPYDDSHMDCNHWKMNEHSVAVFYPAATVVNDIEGTQYVTASLVLPTVYMLIHKVCKGEIVCNSDDSVVQPQQTTPEVRAARANLQTALEDRFIKALTDHVFEQYSIATLLDHRLKSFRFLSQGQRDTAVDPFRAQWTQKWQPQHAERPQPKPAAQKKTGLSALLQDEFEEAAGPGVHVPDLQPDDELSAYMALPVESMQTNVIEWWRRRRTVFPNLSRMARQYLATPATSAGVERLLSAAGLTFGDLAHAMKEETLGCRLLAAYNYTHALYCYP